MLSKPIVRRVVPVLAALVALAVAATMATAANKPRKPKKAKNPIPALVKQSKKESGIVVYGNPPAANFGALVEAFNKKYPWIKVTEYDLEDADIFSKYASESSQGARSADILIASAPNLWVYASRKHFAANFTPNGLENYPKWAQQFPGIFVMSPDPVVNVYNKLLLKDKVPDSLTAIANDPSTYSKVTSYDADNTFGYTALYGYQQLKGWSNLEKLGKRWVAGGHVSGQLQLVAQGGAQVAYLTSPTAKLAISSDPKLKQILGWSYVKDGQPIVPRGIAVTRKATSPASARLFLDFIYSKAGQLAMCDAGFTAYMNGYNPPDGCQNTLAYVTKLVGAKNIYNPGFTQKFVNARPAFTKRWHQIFG